MSGTTEGDGRSMTEARHRVVKDACDIRIVVDDEDPDHVFGHGWILHSYREIA